MADAKAAFGSSLRDWKAKLGHYEQREHERVARSRVPAEVFERMLAQREDEISEPPGRWWCSPPARGLSPSPT